MRYAGLTSGGGFGLLFDLFCCGLCLFWILIVLVCSSLYL